MSDWTRGDDPVYDGYRENWKAQAEADYEAECAEEEERHDIMAGIPTDRLRELAEAEREGRINISQYPNCGMCKRVTVDMFAKREPCKSCKSRALAEKGEADGK